MARVVAQVWMQLAAVISPKLAGSSPRDVMSATRSDEDEEEGLKRVAGIAVPPEMRVWGPWPL